MNEYDDNNNLNTNLCEKDNSNRQNPEEEDIPLKKNT